MTSSTHERKSKTHLVCKHGRFAVQHNTMSDDVPIVVLLKAMGVGSDQEVLQLVGSAPLYAQAMTASLQESSRLEVFSQQKALEYISRKIRNVGRPDWHRPRRTRVLRRTRRPHPPPAHEAARARAGKPAHDPARGPHGHARGRPVLPAAAVAFAVGTCAQERLASLGQVAPCCTCV